MCRVTREDWSAVAPGMQVGSHHSGCRSISHAGQGLTGEVPGIILFFGLLTEHLPRPLPSHSGVVHNFEGPGDLGEYLPDVKDIVS